jgi:predicted N-formylglutamate amidohydrolase
MALPFDRPGRPVLRVAPRALAEVLLTCEHASRRLPAKVGVSARERSILTSHWGWDIGGWAMTRELAAKLSATALGGAVSRLWVDLNRRVDDPTLFRTQVDGHELSWNRKLSRVERLRRLEHWHAPYHGEIDRQINRHVLAGIRPLIFAIHSFTPEFAGRARSYEIGVLYDRYSRAARLLGRALGGSGLNVRYNQPYSGRRGLMYSADRHGTHHGLPNLELELNQALFEDRLAARRLASVVATALGQVLATSRWDRAVASG